MSPRNFPPRSLLVLGTLVFLIIASPAAAQPILPAPEDAQTSSAAAPATTQAPAQTPPEPGAETTADTLPPSAIEQPATAPKPPPAVNPREASLAGVLAARQQIEAELVERQRALGSDRARGREQEIEAEIRELSDQLSKLNRNFSELAAGVDPNSVESDETPEELNLTSEVRELLGPLVNELKRATSRPREIDRLRTEISELRERLGQVQRALTRLKRIQDNVNDEQVLAALDEEQRDWNRRKNAMSTSLQVAQQKLDQKLGESQSIAQAMENLFQLFFKSRGRNLLLALVAMTAFLFLIRKIRAFLSGHRIVSSRAESFEGRVLGLISSAFTVVGAVLVFLVSLYFFGDWVLLILVLLLILGLIWTSKQAIPRFWSQTVLILDMGVVREGERVLYNGIPWLVESISFYSTLTNPVLQGGRIRLPIDDLGDLRSRAHGEGEPWFPTVEGDIVLLDDGRPARVEFQSIENVRLRMPGDNTMIVPAATFAGESVERLSGGYRVSISFGLDYNDQAQITTSMRDLLARDLEAKWRDSPWADSLRGISVEFESASASSLDYFIRADLDGTQALDLLSQKRALARYAVDICNEQGWNIPFTQLTLHVAPDSAPIAVPADSSE